ncbi:MAG: 2-hydroxyacid dehydrogenase, partial [Candidatus Hydrogenedentes bacterium]|nr:2-hydroxyacid dehydrogenase [Candidatus Hydrogenedentota bacterium]
MKIAFFSSKSYDIESFQKANEAYHHELHFFESRLKPATVPIALGFPAVCAFVNDTINGDVLHGLARQGTRLLALRCAGFNNVDLAAAEETGITVVRVPAYSPHAVAEHAVGLMLALNRKYHRAFSRVHESNFSLEGLLGFDMFGRTAGIIGTGQIGEAVARILSGFGCRVIAYDVRENPACTALGVTYCTLDELMRESDIITLHCPLTQATQHLIDEAALAKMKDGVMLINTGRGALVDARALIAGLKSRKVGYLGMDVYEEEEKIFFKDLSSQFIEDDIFARLLTFPNVLITSHQAFLTKDALRNIADTTLASISGFEENGQILNGVS